ncbi:SH3 domain-containing protein [Moorellaceae bacterium AZ2]
MERAQILAQATGTITTSSTVRGGPSSSYASLGTVASGTSVTVLEQDGSYYFIQYSTSSGPTRGYVPQTAVSVSGTIPSATYSINKLGLNVYGSTLTVRGGPGTSYASIGSIYNREIVTVLRTEASSWYFIEYKTSNGNKRGYVATSNIRVPSFTYD